MQKSYRGTLHASYVGYVVQAIINNLSPLLFVSFQRSFDLSFAQIGLIISINFIVQIITDLLAARFVDKIGYRVSIVAAHGFSFVGLICLPLLPQIMPPYAGLICATVLLAIGGGLIEVLISPIVEALPSEHKASAMSLLHSFYCWGHVAVVLISTLYFVLFGTRNWIFLPMLWALVPLINGIVFTRVPIRPVVEEGHAMGFKKLFTHKIFYILFLLMICAGASEQAMSQWASLFAESGLQISKTMGDLLGPCLFAALMGLGRLFYGLYAKNIQLKKMLTICGFFCIGCYLLTSLSPLPLLSLVGCALCGLGVSILWPGVFSLSTEVFPKGGTAMFALLALAGDIGCAAGPGFVGLISSAVQSGSMQLFQGLFSGDLVQTGLKTGLLLALVFPLLLLLGIFALRRGQRTKP